MQNINAKKSSFRSSFLEVDITPSLVNNRVTLQGLWGENERLAVKVESPLRMQLLLLEDAICNRSLLVTADIFAFDPIMLDKVRQWSEPWGIQPEAIILNASHTHYAPGTLSEIASGLGRANEAFRDLICQEIGLAIPKLIQELQPAILSYTSADCKIGFNRRLDKNGFIEMRPNPDGSYESYTPILNIRTSAGRCIVVNHGCHPTGLGGAAVISSDFVGAFRDTITNELNSPVVTMFLQGAAGDIKHGRISGGKAQWSLNTEATSRVGQVLGAQVLQALNGSLNEVKGTIAWASTDVSLPFSDIVSIANEASKSENQRHTPDMVKEWASTLSNRYSDSELPEHMGTCVTAVSVGNVAFLCWSGEPVSEFAGKIRRGSHGYDAVFFAGYTNGLQGYFPSDRMLDEGGYESARSKFVYLLPSSFEVGVESKLLASSFEVLRLAKPKQRLLNKDVPHSERRAFFVLSSGRCGTKMLAKLMEPATNANVWHHPAPDLIKEAGQVYQGSVDPEVCFWKNRAELMNETWQKGLIHGETDHYMTAFAPVIADTMPSAKFIVLVRDPRAFVRSGMRRLYYQTDQIWDRYRLSPQRNSRVFQTFKLYSPFEKVCWLWDATYRHILNIMCNLDSDHFKVVYFEQLVADPSVCRQLYDFLELEGYQEAIISEMLGHPQNVQGKGDFPQPGDWTAQLHHRCWEILGDTASAFGYQQYK